MLKRSPSVRVEETISEISLSRTPKDMVFSQTNVNTRQLLKLVEINRLNSEKNQQVNGPTGVVIGGILDSPSPTPAPSTSFSEVRWCRRVREYINIFTFKFVHKFIKLILADNMYEAYANICVLYFRNFSNRSLYFRKQCFTIRTANSSKTWCNGAPRPPRSH